MPKLKDIASPNDIKAMSIEELKSLAAEIRNEIISVTLENGGHLSSNLGVVELTLAAHFVYDAPNDKFLFDVGHQSYAHKLLTGRYSRFSTLRERGGISGFPLMEESEYDAFGAGHSGTAVSAALGYARAGRLRGEGYKVLAIVGDGSFMNGPNMEAVDDVGQAKLPMVVVLNDNEMSIAKNVGGLSKYLVGVRARPGYQSLKRSTKNALDRIPVLGKGLSALMLAIKKLARFLFVNGQFFSSLGFDYLGPVDGHDLEALIDALKAAKDMDRPVLLHVVTKKGKGYAAAESEPDKFHGISPKTREDGQEAYAKVVGETLMRLGKEDKNLVVLTAAMPHGTGSARFAKAYPERFFDVGIAEAHALTQASALAAAGLRPYFAVYSTFLQRAYDQILHDMALQKQPVTLLVSHAGLVGEDGLTHNGCFDLSYLLHVPDICVFSPSSLEELSYLMRWSHDNIADRPVAIRYAKAGRHVDAPVTAMEYQPWPVMKQGEDATLLACGELLHTALEVSKLLSKKGYNVGVVNARVLKPLPKDALSKIAEKPIITLEENVLSGGFGTSVMLELNRLSPRTRLLPIGIENGFVEHAARQEQLEICGLDQESIAGRVLRFLEEGP